MPITEIGFGDEDARRVNKNASGPVVPIFPAPSGEGVAEIVFASASVSSYVLNAGFSTQLCNGGLNTNNATGYGTNFIGCLPPIPDIGTLTPGILNGLPIACLQTIDGNIGAVPYLGTIVVVIGVVAQNFFNSVNINATTLLTTAASFTIFSGFSIWQWANVNAIPATGLYNVSFT